MKFAINSALVVQVVTPRGRADYVAETCKSLDNKYKKLCSWLP